MKQRKGLLGYNRKEARRILEGSLEDRTINYAQQIYGKGEEVAVALSKGNYRQGSKDPLEVLDQVCGKPKVLEAEVVDVKAGKYVVSHEMGLEEVVKYGPKPSKLEIALKGTVNLANKTCCYYPFLGALPARYQEKIAEKKGDNAKNYAWANIGAELVISSAVGYASAGPLGAFTVGACSLLHSYVRAFFLENKKSLGGTFYLALPFYATLVFKAVRKAIPPAAKAVKEAAITSYTSVGQDQKLLPSPKEDAKNVSSEKH